MSISSPLPSFHHGSASCSNNLDDGIKINDTQEISHKISADQEQARIETDQPGSEFDQLVMNLTKFEDTSGNPVGDTPSASERNSREIGTKSSDGKRDPDNSISDNGKGKAQEVGIKSDTGKSDPHKVSPQGQDATTPELIDQDQNAQSNAIGRNTCARNEVSASVPNAAANARVTDTQHDSNSYTSTTQVKMINLLREINELSKLLSLDPNKTDWYTWNIGYCTVNPTATKCPTPLVPLDFSKSGNYGVKSGIDSKDEAEYSPHISIDRSSIKDQTYSSKINFNKMSAEEKKELFSTLKEWLSDLKNATHSSYSVASFISWYQTLIAILEDNGLYDSIPGLNDNEPHKVESYIVNQLLMYKILHSVKFGFNFAKNSKSNIQNLLMYFTKNESTSQILDKLHKLYLNSSSPTRAQAENFLERFRHLVNLVAVCSILDNNHISDQFITSLLGTHLNKGVFKLFYYRVFVTKTRNINELPHWESLYEEILSIAESHEGTRS